MHFLMIYFLRSAAYLWMPVSILSAYISDPSICEFLLHQ